MGATPSDFASGTPVDGVLYLHAGCRRHVGEVSVAVVAIQGGERTLEGPRRTIRAADAGEAEVLRQIDRTRPADVVADEQIEIGIIVVVDPGRTRAPGVGLAGDAGGGRDIGEAAASVAIEMARTDGRHEDVRPAVVVEITDGDAHAVEALREASFRADVREAAAAVVAIQRNRGSRVGSLVRRATGPRPRLPVDEQQILVAVVVGVENGDTSAHGFGQEFLPLGAADAREADARLSGDVSERDGGRTDGRFARLGRWRPWRRCLRDHRDRSPPDEKQSRGDRDNHRKRDR